MRTSNDRRSIVPPIMPQGGFSPLRLEGWDIRRDLPVDVEQLSRPRHTLADVRFVVALRASALICPKSDLSTPCTAPPCSGLPHLPQGSSLRIWLCCPIHHHLIDPIRPARGHIPTSSHRLIWDASAVRERLGHPRAVPVFRCTFLAGMPSPETPGVRTLISSRAATST